MKKIFALLLAVLMIFSMAACSQPEEPKLPAWSTKEVVVPTLEFSTQKVSFSPLSGVNIDTQLIVSPLTYEKYQPESTIKEIQKLDFMKNYQLQVVYNETGIPHLSDQGQFTSYMYGDVFTFQEVRNNELTGNEVILQYLNETDVAIGYSSILVDVMYSSRYTKLTQEQIGEILKLVYGPELGEYVCYAPMNGETPDAVGHVITMNDAACVIERAYTKSEVYFTVACQYLKEGNAGYDADYISPIDLTEAFQLLHWTPEECDITNLNTFGKTFLQKYYGNTAKFYTYDSSYYRAMTGNVEEGVMRGCAMQCAIGNPADEKGQAGIELQYQNVNGVTDMLITLCVDVLPKNQVNAANSEKARNKALEMAQDILSTEDVIDFTNPSKRYTAQFGDQVYTYMFDFGTEQDDDGTEFSLLYISIATVNNPESENQ